MSEQTYPYLKALEVRDVECAPCRDMRDYKGAKWQILEKPGERYGTPICSWHAEQWEAKREAESRALAHRAAAEKAVDAAWELNRGAR